MVLKTYVVLCCVVAFALAVDKYNEKYDNIDLKPIMENERLFNNYAKCILDEGPCTPEGKELRGEWNFNDTYIKLIFLKILKILPKYFSKYTI